jgi:hypothetical protein
MEIIGGPFEVTPEENEYAEFCQKRMDARIQRLNEAGIMVCPGFESEGDHIKTEADLAMMSVFTEMLLEEKDYICKHCGVDGRIHSDVWDS